MLTKRIKKNIKKLKIANFFNAYIKCYQDKRQYKNIVTKYSHRRQKYTFEELLIQKGFTKRWVKNLQNRRLNIYFSGTSEPQDKSGFIQALEKFGNLSYFVKYDGGYGRYSGDILYNGIKGRVLNTNKIIEDIQNLINSNNKPDFVLMQAMGKSYEIDRLKQFKEESGLKFINYTLDDRFAYYLKTPKNEKYNYGIHGIQTLIDFSLVSNPEVTEWHLKEDIPAVYFPMASSLDIYFPIKCEKKYDVGFIGHKYGYREELVNALIKAGINVETRGSGWPSGIIKFEDNNIFFNECRIVLGIGTIGHCKDFYNQKLRDFEATLSGSVYVTHNNKDLKELFVENEELILCNNIDEYISSIKEILGDEVRLINISQRAHKRSSKDHTYELRFHELFKLLGIIDTTKDDSYSAIL
jgi:spore maturation protein CgeB